MVSQPKSRTETSSKQPTDANFASHPSHPKPEPATFSTEFQNPLLSAAFLCDNGCEVIFKQTNVTIQLNTKTILTGYCEGYCEQRTGLWRVKLDDQQKTINHNIPGHANSIVPAGTIADTIKFLHMACFSPSTLTLLRAVEHGNFATWPMFTSNNIKKYLPKPEASAMGHLDQHRKNTQSTKRTPAKTSTAHKTPTPTDAEPNGLPTNDTSEPSIILSKQTHQTYADLLDFNSPTGQIHNDQTGRFPVQSSRGSKYVMILYEYDSKPILAEAMKFRTAHNMVCAYKRLHAYLVARGLTPKLQRLDNEASQTLKDPMRKKNIDFQLAAPLCHRRNSAERAIQTWKNHFIAGLASTGKQFLLYLWDRLIPQAVTTPNLLRQSCLNPCLSANANSMARSTITLPPWHPPAPASSSMKSPHNAALRPHTGNEACTSD
jgi:hypothetical protein